MAKKQRPGGDEGGGANWMDTYGDLVTLLLCLFVLLYSFSILDSKKFEGVAAGMRLAFNAEAPVEAVAIPGIEMQQVVSPLIEPLAPSNPNADAATDPTQADAERNPNQREMELLSGMIQDYMGISGLIGDVVPDFDSMMLTIRFQENILFDSGRAELRPEAEEMLDTMIDLFVAHDAFIHNIRVEGHTDNVPLRGGYRDNWELSSIRATNAARYIVDSGRIEGGRIAAMGCGEERPVGDNNTDEGRRANRRVDFVIESINIEALRALSARPDED